VLCLRQGRFNCEIRIIVFALVLASLVKTRLKDFSENCHAILRSEHAFRGIYLSVGIDFRRMRTPPFFLLK